MVDGPNMYNYVNANPVNYIDEWGEYGISIGPIVIPGPDLIGPSMGTHDILNPNGTGKRNKTKPVQAGVKEEANNPTAQVNKAETGNGDNEEEKGKQDTEKGEQPETGYRTDKPPSKPHFDRKTGKKESEHWHYRDYNWNPKTKQWELGKWKYGGTGQFPK